MIYTSIRQHLPGKLNPQLLLIPACFAAQPHFKAAELAIFSKAVSIALFVVFFACSRKGNDILLLEFRTNANYSKVICN